MIKLSALEDLRKSLNIKESKGKKTLKHTINRKTAFLPFQTRNPERAKFKTGFSPVLGQFFRNVEGLKSKFELDEDKIIQDICNQVQMNDEDRPHFERILESIRTTPRSIRIFHPMMYKYVPLLTQRNPMGKKISLSIYLMLC